MVFEHRNSYMPEVKVFAHKLKNFWLDTNLRVSETDNLFKHGSWEYISSLLVKLAGVLDQVLGHLVEIGRKLMLILTLQNFLPNLPKDFAEYFISDAAIVAVLRVDSNYFRQWQKHVFQLHVLVYLKILRKVWKYIFSFLVKLVLFCLFWNRESNIFIVHRYQPTWLSNLAHFCILLEAVEQEIEKIFNLAKLSELFVVVGRNFEHEVVNFVFEGTACKLFEDLE